MRQETGETRDAIMDDVSKRIEAILSTNKSRSSPYWLVIFAKPSKQSVDGKHTLIQHVKAYGVKPSSQVGMLIGMVDNSTSKIEWEINMPQRPFDFSALQKFGATPCNEVVTETTTIPGAYITR